MWKNTVYFSRQSREYAENFFDGRRSKVPGVRKNKTKQQSTITARHWRKLRDPHWITKRARRLYHSKTTWESLLVTTKVARKSNVNNPKPDYIMTRQENKQASLSKQQWRIQWRHRNKQWISKENRTSIVCKNKKITKNICLCHRTFYANQMSFNLAGPLELKVTERYRNI